MDKTAYIEFAKEKLGFDFLCYLYPKIELIDLIAEEKYKNLELISTTEDTLSL